MNDRVKRLTEWVDLYRAAWTLTMVQWLFYTFCPLSHRREIMSLVAHYADDGILKLDEISELDRLYGAGGDDDGRSG